MRVNHEFTVQSKRLHVLKILKHVCEQILLVGTLILIIAFLNVLCK